MATDFQSDPSERQLRNLGKRHYDDPAHDSWAVPPRDGIGRLWPSGRGAWMGCPVARRHWPNVNMDTDQRSCAVAEDRQRRRGDAVKMLLANTATKLFFRSTDGMAQRYVRDLCPLTPDRPCVADVRPLSTLRPGECYAVLADGRMERRRLGQFDSPRQNPAEQQTRSSSSDTRNQV